MHIKLVKEIRGFCDTEIEKHKFCNHKNPILIDDVDINKIVISKEVSFGIKDFKYLIGYKDNEKVKPFCIIFRKMNRYTKRFNGS